MRFAFVSMHTFVIALIGALCLTAHGANIDTTGAAAAAVVTEAVSKSVCDLPKEIGPCRKSDPVFYHNAATKQCEEFLYGGCLGNENRFEAKEDCERTCSVKPQQQQATTAANVETASSTSTTTAGH